MSTVSDILPSELVLDHVAAVPSPLSQFPADDDIDVSDAPVTPHLASPLAANPVAPRKPKKSSKKPVRTFADVMAAAKLAHPTPVSDLPIVPEVPAVLGEQKLKGKGASKAKKPKRIAKPAALKNLSLWRESCLAIQGVAGVVRKDSPHYAAVKARYESLKQQQ